MFHHQAGVFAGAVGIEVWIGHIDAHPLVVGDIGDRRVGLFTRCKGGANERFRLVFTIDHRANQANTLL